MAVDLGDKIWDSGGFEPDLGGTKFWTADVRWDNNYIKATNTSECYVYIMLSTANYSDRFDGSAYVKGTVSVNGAVTNIDNAFDVWQNQTWTTEIYSVTHYIKHDEYGLKIIPIDIDLTVDGNSTLKKHYNLELQSGRPSSPYVVSCDNFDDESNPTVTYAVPKPDRVTSLELGMSFDRTIDIIKYRPVNKNSSSYTFNFTDAERQTLQSELSHTSFKNIYIYIRAVFDGKTLYHSIVRTVKIVNAQPLLSPTVEDININTINLTGDHNKLIRYYSTAQVKTNATAQKQAVIVKCRVSNGGQAINTANGEIYNALGGDFEFYVEDSRTYFTKKIVTKQTVPYIRLTCNNESYSTLEPDNSIKLHIVCSGNYFNSSFGAKHNTLTVNYRYKEKNKAWGEWHGATPQLQTSSYRINSIIPSLPVNSTFTVQFLVRDALSGDVYSAETVCAATPIFDWSDRDFNFNVPVNFSAGATGLGVGLEEIAQIQSDINSLKTRLDGINDYIVASGYSDTWYWRKWNNGTAECWRSFRFKANVTTGWGGVYASSANFLAPVAYPFEFVNDAACMAGWENLNSDYWLATHKPAGTRTMSPAYQTIRGSAYNNVDAWISLYVIGKWK